MTDQADILAAQLAPYRETPGIVAALLISRDGFVIAADADPGFKTDAVAAQVAGVIDIGARLAAELRQPEAKYISVDFDDLNLVLAPFGSELMLVLAGAPSALICEYRLSTTRRLTARAGAAGRTDQGDTHGRCGRTAGKPGAERRRVHPLR